MIKELFIPATIRGYQVLPKRVIGFDLGKTSVKATVIYIKGRETLIESFHEQPIPAGLTGQEYQDQCAQAIKNIIAQIPHYDEIHSALSSSQVVFKELKLPFTGRDKIKMVVEHEVEPLLPFSLSDAVVDFIITKEVKEEQSSHVLVAAVQNQYIASHLALFAAAGVQPNVITIDLIALYGLYREIPAYASLSSGVVLLEIEPYSTRLIYIFDGQLRLLRTLNKGLAELSKAIGQRLSITPEEALERIFRYGMEPDHNQEQLKTIKEAFTAFFQDITFTLQSFITQARPTQSINKILIFGASALVKGLPTIISELTATQCEVFSLQSFLANQNQTHAIKTKNSISPLYQVSLATALETATTKGFNLRQKGFAPSDSSLLNKQLLIALGLAGFILAALLGTTFWQIRKLKNELYESEQEVAQVLKDRFRKIPEDENDLDSVMSNAQSALKEEEKLWFAFSGSARSKFLKYLLELTTKLDKESLGLQVEKITISEGTMTLKAQVKGYEELKSLERDLRTSKLFSYIEPQNDPNFTMVIRLAKTE